MGGISIWQLLIVAVIVVLLFGTKKLGSIGSDLGASIKGFKKAMSDDDAKQDKPVRTLILPLNLSRISKAKRKKEDAKSQDKEQV
ncbi:sec-independent protein translocase protein [Salmonella enterica subsp. enterica]|uniref:Sec-independent protein translocase protein TatA n=1 Tax=Salmonella enterica I TaxID=59201 RepID=A0A447PSC7_SALET|nr:sec-independent protein translocase protein [Salmonella enterica subsp. enterica]